MAIVESECSTNMFGNLEPIKIIMGPFDKPSAFKTSTLAFIENCKKKPQAKYDIRTISEQMGFRQRRFYEVVNVFDALGVCYKYDSETFQWIGFEQVRYKIEMIASNRGAFFPNYSLEKIFSNRGCISVQKVTEEFILLYIALEMRRINILEAATYLSRENDREKTTRCKLYQVAAILEIANVIKKTDKPSEFELMPEYFISASEKMNRKIIDPSSIVMLLNRPEPFCMNVVSPIIKSRIHEYYSTNF